MEGRPRGAPSCHHSKLLHACQYKGTVNQRGKEHVRLIAEEPVPLAVVGVVHRQVVENGVGSVLVLEAENIILALESIVARRLARARKRFLDEPLGVSVEGLLDANTERSRDLVG